MAGRKVTRISFAIALSVLMLMWLVFALDYLLELDLYRFGVHPGKWEGLVGVIASPFLHSTRDVGHILNNSVPAFILIWLIFYHYRKIATKSFLMIYLLAGLGTWVLGNPNYHIGMSGVIYGLTSFLVFSGFFRKNMRVAGISLFVIFVYGSLVWGIFPMKVGVSWEGHLAGLFAGIIVAVLFKQKGPQPAKMRYELEEELGIEPELEYWKEGFVPPAPPVLAEHKPKIIIKYNYVPTKKPITDEEE
jgi:membrane associated rhomboid family serine protease